MSKEGLGDISVLTQEYILEVNGNQYKFRPVYLSEIDEYFRDNVVIMENNDPQKYADTVKLYFLSDEFINSIYSSEKSDDKNQSSDIKKNKLKEFIRKIKEKIFNKYSYKSQKARMVKKWLEKKMTIIDEKGKEKKIKFEELERKYLWKKADIGKALNFLSKISGF